MKGSKRGLFIALILFLSAAIFYRLVQGRTIKLSYVDSCLALAERLKTKPVTLEPSNFEPGESLKYSINLKGIKVGSAELAFLGSRRLQDKQTNIFVFSSKALNFSDIETIYAQPQDYLPVRIERDLNLWGKRMNILEEYNQKENCLKIIKTQGKKITQDEITHDSNIQNIILLVYKYRAMKELKIGQIDTWNLPTKQIKMQVVKLEEINVPFGRFNAFVLESEPRGYRFWLSVQKEKLPLRLEGFSGLGATTLVLADVTPD